MATPGMTDSLVGKVEAALFQFIGGSGKPAPFSAPRPHGADRHSSDLGPWRRPQDHTGHVTFSILEAGLRVLSDVRPEGASTPRSQRKASDLPRTRGST